MSYIGREPASQAITTADIADGAFTLNHLNFTDIPTNLDITGTIDKNTMRLAEGVTVIGDVTISDDLVLAKLSDDGVGITMTTDGTTRTITGSGSIESTTIAQTHSPSLTGMTGTLSNSISGIEDTTKITHTIHTDQNSSPGSSSGKGASTSSENRSLGYGTTWIEHLKTEHFTTVGQGSVEIYVTLGHGSESGAVRAQGAFSIEAVSGSFTYTDVSELYGENQDSNWQESFKQGHTANLSHGQNTHYYKFQKVVGGKYQVKFWVRNIGASSTAIWNNFVSQVDKMQVYYRG